MDMVFEYLTGTIDAAIADFSAGWFVLGLILFLVSLFFLFVHFHSRLKGLRLPGKIKGAVKKTNIKEKTRDGKTVQETKETFFIVYEYKKPDGTPCTEIASNGGGSGELKKYRTGQRVNLLVCPADGYDDVYDAGDKAALILGLIFLLIGLFLMSIMLLSHGFNLIFWGSVLGVLVPGGKKFARYMSRSKPSSKERPALKSFTPEDVRPVEYFKGGE